MRIDKQHRAAETDGNRRPGSPPVVAQDQDSGDNHENSLDHPANHD
ncbi:MAG: hypothetical protein WCD33_21980 [Mycobacterium sp.]